MVADLRMASPTAVELVNPKHRNERKTHMALITSYHVPGLYVEDHSIDVPLDWRGLEPMLLAVGSTMRRGAMPAPIQHARRRTSSSVTSPALSCAILSTCAW